MKEAENNMSGRDGTEPIGGRDRSQGQGQGLKGGFSLGPGGKCRCTHCGYTEPHQVGVPCYDKKCPKCGATMLRD